MNGFLNHHHSIESKIMFELFIVQLNFEQLWVYINLIELEFPFILRVFLQLDYGPLKNFFDQLNSLEWFEKLTRVKIIFAENEDCPCFYFSVSKLLCLNYDIGLFNGFDKVSPFTFKLSLLISQLQYLGMVLSFTIGIDLNGFFKIFFNLFSLY